MPRDQDRWMARCACGHVLWSETICTPEVGGELWCRGCEAVVEVVDVVSSAPERDARGRI